MENPWKHVSFRFVSFQSNGAKPAIFQLHREIMSIVCETLQQIIMNLYLIHGLGRTFRSVFVCKSTKMMLFPSRSIGLNVSKSLNRKKFYIFPNMYMYLVFRETKRERISEYYRRKSNFIRKNEQIEAKIICRRKHMALDWMPEVNIQSK